MHAGLKIHTQKDFKTRAHCYNCLKITKTRFSKQIRKNWSPEKVLDPFNKSSDDKFRTSRWLEKLRHTRNLKGKIWNRIENANYFNIFTTL